MPSPSFYLSLNYAALPALVLQTWWVFLPILPMIFVPGFERAMMATLVAYGLVAAGTIAFGLLACVGSSSECWVATFPTVFAAVVSIPLVGLVFLIRLLVYVFVEVPRQRRARQTSN